MYIIVTVIVIVTVFSVLLHIYIHVYTCSTAFLFLLEGFRNFLLYLSLY